MEDEFEILEKGPDYFIAEMGQETYLVEDEGFDSEEGVYEFSVGDSDTVYGSSGDFNSPNEVRLLEGEVDGLNSYDEVAEKVLERGVNGGKEKDLEGLDQFY